MRIIAESRPVTAMPFVHLGYTAASLLVPQGTVLLTGCILVVAGIGMVLGFTKRKRRGEAQTGVERRPSRFGMIGMWVLLLGIAFIPLAWVAGSYPYGDRATDAKMSVVMRFIQRKVAGASESGDTNPFRELPTQAGVYDLVELVEGGQMWSSMKDGWYVPMKLKVVVTDREKPDYLLMSAGEDRTWNTEDDFTSRKYEERWRAQRALEKELAAGNIPTPSTENMPDKQEGGQSQ